MEVQTPVFADPMLALMASECETVEDEFEVQALLDADELVAAAETLRSFFSKE